MQLNLNVSASFLALGGVFSHSALLCPEAWAGMKSQTRSSVGIVDRLETLAYHGVRGSWGFWVRESGEWVVDRGLSVLGGVGNDDCGHRPWDI